MITNTERDLAAALSELAEIKEMLAAARVIDIGNCTISNNGNPEGLIALRQFDGDGNLLSYTHHDSFLDAYKSIKEASEMDIREAIRNLPNDGRFESVWWNQAEIHLQPSLRTDDLKALLTHLEDTEGKLAKAMAGLEVYANKRNWFCVEYWCEREHEQPCQLRDTFYAGGNGYDHAASVIAEINGEGK